MLLRGGLAGSLCLFLALAAHADSFGTGANAFKIPFVRVGAPGNDADRRSGPSNIGAVDYEYRIAKFELPEEAINKANALGGLGIPSSSRGEAFPVTNITWFDMARFVNWLNTSSGFEPAYKFNTQGDFELWAPGDPGYDPDNLFRSSLTNYVLPSLDEWHKAAYYDASAGRYVDYATGSDDVPTPVDELPIPSSGSMAPGTAVFSLVGPSAGPAEVTRAGGAGLFGAVGQSGNVSEWTESIGANNPEIDANRFLKGGDWGASPSGISHSAAGGTAPSNSGNALGFRVASLIIPEPSSAGIAFVAITAGLLRRNWRR